MQISVEVFHSHLSEKYVENTFQCCLCILHSALCIDLLILQLADEASYFTEGRIALAVLNCQVSP